MSNAWETTTDDVATVIDRNGIFIDYDRLDEIVDFQLDHDAIEKIALEGKDMDEQVELAYNEIERQLRAIGEIE